MFLDTFQLFPRRERIGKVLKNGLECVHASRAALSKESIRAIRFTSRNTIPPPILHEPAVAGVRTLAYFAMGVCWLASAN
jgi:hypothetical protein